jgi:hypothetical protein
MYNAEYLKGMAGDAAEAARSLSKDGHSKEALISLNTCAIYTIGAELIDRLDNLHFSFDADHNSRTEISRIVGHGFFEVRRPNDISNKEQDSDD